MPALMGTGDGGERFRAAEANLTGALAGRQAAKED